MQIERIDLSLSSEEFYKKYGRKKIISTFTLGCKVNQYETEAMAELFQSSGYEVVDHEDRADVYVINTCTVTSLGDKKSRQFIRRAKRTNPEAMIAVVGCYSQIAPDDVMAIEGVNLVLGTNDRKKIVEFIENMGSGEKISVVGDIMKVREFEELEIDKVQDKTRAFLKIQEGCNKYCSYCIIPYARGPVRSRKLENIISEVKRLAENGFKEVVLTGIHVASYGKDLGEVGLLDVIKAVDEIEGIERIRLSSLEPTVITDDFIEAISKMDKFCNHFHLSLQSGSDSVLKRMNRKYTTDQYFEIVEKLNDKLDNPSMTTDIIVGFPGETDQEFQETFAFAEKVGFAKIHVFKYSPREGTPAAIMTGQVDPQVKSSRSEKLIALADKMESDYLDGHIGKTVKVLFEAYHESSDTYEGLTDHYIRVFVKSDKNLIGKLENVQLLSCEGDKINGIII